MNKIISKMFGNTGRTSSETELATLEVTLEALCAFRDRLVMKYEIWSDEERDQCTLANTEIGVVSNKIFALKY
jgi:hypothetical protein